MNEASPSQITQHQCHALILQQLRAIMSILEGPEKTLEVLLDVTRIPGQLILNCIQLLSIGDSFDLIVEPFRDDLEELDCVKDIVEVDGILDSITVNIPKHLYCKTLEDLKKDVKQMLLSPGIAHLSPGTGTLNFRTMLFRKFRDSKQNALPYVYAKVMQKMKRNAKASKYILEFLLDEEAFKMKYNELVEFTEEELNAMVDDIFQKTLKKNHFVELKVLKSHMHDCENHKFDFHFFHQLMDYIFGHFYHHNRQSIESELQQLLTHPNKPRKELQENLFCVLVDYLIYKNIVKEVMAHKWFKKDSPVETNKKAMLTVFRVNQRMAPTAKYGDDCFVFRSDVEKIIKTKKGRQFDDSFPKDTESIFYCMKYKDAITMIIKACGPIDLDVYFSNEPEIGYYSCVPIISPINTLCKPAFTCITDLYNFLAFEVKLYNAHAHEQTKEYSNAFFAKFCDRFPITSDKMFCIDYHEFQLFLEEAREHYNAKKEAKKSSDTPPPKESRIGWMLINHSKIMAQHGLCGFGYLLKQQLDNVEVNRTYGVHDDISFFAYMLECPKLYICFHNQVGCQHPAGRCCLKK